MKYAGVDYSLTSPAIAIYDKESSGQFSFEHCRFYYLTDTTSLMGSWKNVTGDMYPVWSSDEHRYDQISQWALTRIAGADRISIEGYSMGSRGRVFNLAENCGLLKWQLYKQQKDFILIPPTVVKKFATGKGNANKQAMYEAFVKETGVPLHEILTPKRKDVSSPVTDIVDAYYILKYRVAQDKNLL